MVIYFRNCLSIIFVFITSINFSQTPSQGYFTLAEKALSYYYAKDYKKSAITYSLAFKANDGKGTVEDRYNAACSWALANYPDSAFFQLNKIVSKGHMSDCSRIIND